jgi:oligosaccharide repeat unit polymerase
VGGKHGDFMVVPQLFLLTHILILFVTLVNVLTETRLPVLGYVVVAAVYVASAIYQVGKDNFFAAALGSTITVVLSLGVLLEMSEKVDFTVRYTSLVYRPELIGLTYVSLTVAGSVFFAFCFALAPQEPWSYRLLSAAERDRVQPFVFLALALGILFAAITVPRGVIFENSYSYLNERAGQIVQSSGLKLMGSTFLVLALGLGISAYGYRSRMYMLVTLVAIAGSVYFYLFRGDRGGALPVFVAVLLIGYLFSEKGRGFRLVTLVVALLVMLSVYQVFGYYRSFAWRSGFWEGVQVSWQGGLISLFDSRGASGGSSLTKLSMLPQSYWHMLHTIDLYESGNQLGGRSFGDVVGQSVPKFVADFIGYERPESGSVRLSRYRVHGGGMYVIALAYWNLGLLGVFVVSCILGWFASWLERWYRRQTPALMGSYLAAVGTVPYSMFYGWQSLVKGIEITLLVALALRAMFPSLRPRAVGLAAQRSGRLRYPNRC